MKHKKVIARIVWLAACISVLVAAPILIAANTVKQTAESSQMNMLTVWQIDSFEGGKGSRANYLQKLGNEFTKETKCYVQVLSLSSEAARQNLKNGARPDLISYGAGAYGIESYITDKTASHIWAHGGYCILTVSENADFSDVSAANTVLNCGTENFAQIAALMRGLAGAAAEKPTEAYISLIGGKYKYLLGTQRDIFRLITREVQFKVEPITEFNDLFQLISVTATDGKNIYFANEFIEFINNNSQNLNKIGLMGDKPIYDDAMAAMEGLNYRYKLASPISSETKTLLNGAIKNSDINLIKNLLN